MQPIRSLLVSVVALGAASPIAAEELQLPRVSPRATIHQVVGLTEVTISYSRPAVRGRTIWGDLVPYDQVWRTGANEATVIELSTDVGIEGHALPAGRYSLHTIPTPDAWTIIFNRQTQQWGSFDHDPARDALRFQVRPRRTTQHREWMEIGFRDLGMDRAEVVLHWERLLVSFTIKTDAVRRSLEAIEESLAEVAADDWRTLHRAAYFCYNAGIRLERALDWVRRSITVEARYDNLQLEAMLLARRGELGAAVAAAERALAANAAAERPLDTTHLRLLVSSWQTTLSDRGGGGGSASNR